MFDDDQIDALEQESAELEAVKYEVGRTGKI